MPTMRLLADEWRRIDPESGKTTRYRRGDLIEDLTAEEIEYHTQEKKLRKTVVEAGGDQDPFKDNDDYKQLGSPAPDNSVKSVSAGPGKAAVSSESGTVKEK